MLRMYLLQNWFNLSDEGVEDAIYDSYAFRKFMGIDFLKEEQAPDATTLFKFRKLLNDSGITKLFFDSDQWYFGERLHAGVDAGTGYIHSMEVTAANVNERDVVPALIREDDEVVYGDAGYTGIEKREEIMADPHLSSIQYRMNSQKPYRKNKWNLGEGI